MSNKKKPEAKDAVASVNMDETPKEKPASERKKAFEKLIERYKKQNPVKYEMKKARLAETLKNIK